jgi:hypothetical protein
MINLYEKFGDFLLSVVGMIIAGIILSAVMSDKQYSETLYVSSSVIVLGLFLVAFISFRENNKNLTTKK